MLDILFSVVYKLIYRGSEYKSAKGIFRSRSQAFLLPPADDIGF